MFGIFGVDPALDGMASEVDVFLAKRERLAGGDLDLLFDEIDAGDHFGDRMFDLDAGVDLDEVEVVVGIDQKFTGARVDIADGLRQAERRPRKACVRTLSGKRRCGRFFDELLMAALQAYSRGPSKRRVSPCESARIWTSTWRGRSMNFSR